MCGSGEAVTQRWKVAVATSDGQKIDRHLGQSDEFFIYALEQNGGYELVERRKPVDGQRLDLHSEASFGALFADVDVVLASQAGPGAIKTLLGHGVHAFAVRGSVERALQAYARRGWMLGPADASRAGRCGGGSGGGGCSSGSCC